MERITGFFTMIVALLGLSHREKPNMDQRIIDAYDKSYESWVAKGWVEPR